MNKLTFPKGSLKFKKIKDSEIPDDYEKSEEWRRDVSLYKVRKRYTDVLEKLFPHEVESQSEESFIPDEIIMCNTKLNNQVREMRKRFKELPSFSSAHTYEVTFKHPKWSKVIGDIVLNTKRSSLKDALKAIVAEFKAKKNEHRQIRKRSKVTEIKSFKYKIQYDVSGGCIYMPEVKDGVYLKFIKDQEKRIVFTDKVPKDKANYVGIELEFMCDWDQEKLGYALYDIGVGKQVTVTDDGSLRCCGNYKPNQCSKHKDKFLHEVCILVKENDYKDTIKKVCSVLSKANSVVNKTCGMHVHLDMRNRDAEKAYQNLISSQNILFKMNPKSRQDVYAKKVTNRDFEAVVNTSQSGMEYRYLGVNPIAMKKHNTIEIRIHSGTIDYTKIVNWIELLLIISNHEKRIQKNFVSLKIFAEEYQIGKDLKTYMIERIRKFKPDVVEGINVEPEQGVA